MQEAFGIVLFVVVVVAVLAALANSLASGDSAYDQIGRGGPSLRDGGDLPADQDRPGAPPCATRRSVRCSRGATPGARGKEPLDVEAELRTLERPTPASDAALAAELRQLVVARDARRERQGKPPLDVEAEVARRMRDLQAG